MDEAASGLQRFGKYELVHELGHGGMAVVHQAVQHGMGGFNRPVVIKRILPELAGEEPFVKMFVEEARLSALLDHPNIVQIHDFGVIDGSYFLAMEYIEGIPLHRAMRYFSRHRPIPAEAAAYIMHQVCIGLQYAHTLSRDGSTLGIVHRDVSPANIMLSVHGTVKLLDFGIAKAAQAIDREETRTGTLKGKWSYMSPEQVLGQQVTSRSDIFSAGIVLWELLTGRRLFKARTDFLTLSNVVQARILPVTQLRPDLPAGFDQICHRALARKVRERYQTAEAMADDLEAVLDRSYSATLLATLVAEVQLQKATVRDEEVSGDSDSGSSTSTSNSGKSVQTHASRHGRRPDLLERRPWLLPAVMAAAAAAVIALVLVYLLVPAPPRPGAAPPLSARVRLRAHSTPVGASLSIAGELHSRGKTPIVIEVARSTEPIKLIVALAGHGMQEETVVPDRDRVVHFKLHHEGLPRAPARGDSLFTPRRPEPKRTKMAVPEEAAGKKKDESAAKKGAVEKHAATKDAARKDSAKKDAARKDTAKKDAAKKDAAKKDAAKKDAAKKDSAKKDAAKKDSARKHASPRKKDATKKDAATKDAVRKDAAKKDVVTEDAAKKDAATKDVKTGRVPATTKKQLPNLKSGDLADPYR